MTERSASGFKIRNIIFRTLFAGCVLLAVILTAVAMLAGHADKKYRDEKIRMIDTWFFDDNGVEIPCNSRVNLKDYMDEGVLSYTIRAVLPKDVTDSDELGFRISDRQVRIAVAGEEIASFGGKEPLPLWRTDGRYYVFVPLRSEYAGKAIELSITSTYDHERGVIPDFYVGTRWAIYSELQQMYSVRYLIARALVVIGFILLVVYVAFWIINRDRDDKLLTLGLFMIFSCTWVLTEGKLMQFRAGDPYTIYALTFLSLSLIPPSFLSYVNLVQKKRYATFYFFVGMFCMLMTAVYMLLQIFHIRDLQESLVLVHISLVATVFVVFVTTILCYLKHRDRSVRALFFGLLILVPFSLMEILKQYWNKDYKSTGTMFAFAIALFLCVQVYDNVKGFLKLQQEKEEAIKENWDKSIFLANMSHEIRTPMNAIMSMSELLSQSETLPDTEWDYVNTIYSASKNLLDIVNDILDYSKFSAGRYDLVNESYEPASMVSEIEKMLSIKAKEKGLTMTVSMDPRIPKCMIGDEGRVRQIVLNLLNNAVKYTDEGFVDLKVGFRPIDEKSAELIFIVSDSGIGIKEEDMKKLFDEFTQVDARKNRNKEGTGLGLAIARQLAELMGGRITVSSKYGEGSTFAAFVTQEIDPDQKKSKPEKIRKKEEEEEPGELGNFHAPGFRVLAVDDNRVNLKVIRELLKQYGIEPDLASGGRQSIEMLTKDPNYDLVFMDYMMPEIDGREATIEIRKLPGCSEKELPIIALTADVLSGTKETLLSCGMNDYLAKPVKLAELKQIMYKYVPLNMRKYLD